MGRYFTVNCMPWITFVESGTRSFLLSQLQLNLVSSQLTQIRLNGWMVNAGNTCTYVKQFKDHLRTFMKNINKTYNYNCHCQI